MMKRTYVVSKDEKSGLWYAHMVGFPLFTWRNT